MTYIYVKDTLVYVTVDGETIETTKEHPFWVEGQGWTKAKFLEAGDQLRDADGNSLIIDNVEIVPLPENQYTLVYNLEVADFHTYYVADSNILVHNVCQLSEGDIIKTIKSTRRHVQKLMKRDSTAKTYLKNGQFYQYGTYFHSRVFKKLCSANIQGLEIDKAIYKPGTLGGKGNIRRPDFQIKTNNSYRVLDLKPNHYNWQATQQYKDIVSWTADKNPIQLNYNR